MLNIKRVKKEEIEEIKKIDKVVDKNSNEQINSLVDMLIENVQRQTQLQKLFDNTGKGKKEIGKSRNEILEYVESVLKTREIEKALIEPVKKRFADYMWGFYILQEYIDASDIFDIKCHKYNHIRLKKIGGKITSKITFPSKKDYEKFVMAIALRNHISLNDINAEVTFVDKYSSDKFRLRFTISTPLINDNDTFIMEIRKMPKEKYFLKDLINLKMLPEKEANYLKNVMKNGTGVAIFGRGGSGKSILYNALIEEYPHDKAGIILQENPELFSKTHPDIIFQHIVIPHGEEGVNYSLEKLTKFALLFDVEMIGIGEIKDKYEATELAKAVYTGAFGMLTSHGQNAVDGLVKLADYVKQGTGYEIEQCLKMLTGLQACIFMQDFEVMEIIEIQGWDKQNEFLKYSHIYNRKGK